MKEKINQILLDNINNRGHYLAANSCLPQGLGGGIFLQDVCNSHFRNCCNKVKRYFAVDNITPKEYQKIKKSINDIIQKIGFIESDDEKAINGFAEKIIRNQFGIPDNISFQINQPYNFGYGDDVISSFNNDDSELVLDDYSQIEGENKGIDRGRLQYSMVCGAANDSMWAYKPHENGLDDIDYRLCDLYNKFNAFNDFNIWVTPDDVFDTELQTSDDGFKIYQDNDDYIISIQADILPTKLYQMAKAILSILSNEKYNNQMIDYDNHWNTRIGYPMWKKIKGYIKIKRNLPYIIDAISQLSHDDFDYTMKECLMGTKHADLLFETLNSRI